ncbi:MAG: tetratricopeptide repeat protein [Pseudomonadota bacterium]
MPNDPQAYPSIFVSYRIADTLPTADRLALELQRRFGANEVFFDRRTVEPGDSWDSHIETAVKNASFVLVVIGKRWLTEQGEYGQRRLDMPGDWVRREVEEALVGHAEVIPVLVDGVSPPPAEAFGSVPSIASLAKCQGARLRVADWDTDFDALVRKLASSGLAMPSESSAERVIVPGRIPISAKQSFVGRADELNQLAEQLPTIGEPGVVIVRGMPGVGKSELALEYARRHQSHYANGAFLIGMDQGTVPVDLATYGVRNLGIHSNRLAIDEQCLLVLRQLAAPTLLIYDNVTSPDAISPWLPANDEATHVLITSTWEDWRGWRAVEVPPLSEDDARDLVGALGGPEVEGSYGPALVASAAGLPVQLCPATRRVAKSMERLGNAAIAIEAEATSSFSAVWDLLDDEGRLLLSAATFFNPDRIRADLLRSRLQEAGWTSASVDRALDACLDLSLLQAGEELRMHRLFQEFVRSAPGVNTTQLAHFHDTHSAAFMIAAEDVRANPASSSSASNLHCYSLSPDSWQPGDGSLASRVDAYSIGAALVEIGLFNLGRLWFESALEQAEKGNVHGRVDHQALGSSLHQIGYCLLQTGDYEGARPSFERAVKESEQGDVQGRVNHERVGRSLHQVGYCLSRTGNYEGAQTWLKRAVEEKEQGDVYGQVNHESLGRSLHLIGHCFSQDGDYQEAQVWLKRAVEQKEQGGDRGRIDHESLGQSLHLVGYCLSQTGDHVGARRWLEDAVRQKEQGDVHARVNHESLGTSLHLVGLCLSETGNYEAAKAWFERAVQQAEPGDIHGRVDHESLGSSLHQVGYCLFQAGDYERARPWFERAVEQAQRGDVHGRIDHESLGSSLHQVGYCLAETGDYTAAQPWLKQAVEEKETGDVYGRVDHESLGKSLHQVGYCLSQAGDYEGAKPWLERAAERKEHGDVHGRVDYDSLGSSLHQVGYCLCEAGDFEAAKPWLQRAVEQKGRGDVHGSVDHESLGKTLHQVGYCLSRTGDHEGARPWLERAIEEKEQGDAHGRVDHASVELTRQALHALAGSSAR